jgi:type IV secretory pathway VirB3-like protein
VLVTIAVFSVSFIKPKGMYKVIFTLVLAVASLMGLHAQEFQGMAVYESKPVRRILNREWRATKYDPDMQKMIEERMKRCLKNIYSKF